KDGSLLGKKGSWQLKGNTLELHLGQETFDLQVGAAWYWEDWKSTIIMTGLSKDGTAVWAKRR
ncbi:MAG TPA: hypothetical protein DDW40_08500, partial [Exiguobacterium sp.]|nr:hypothetical protein [Exiguobacterium sp.]